MCECANVNVIYIAHYILIFIRSKIQQTLQNEKVHTNNTDKTNIRKPTPT